jgi:hypothetical protein
MALTVNPRVNITKASPTNWNTETKIQVLENPKLSMIANIIRP